MTIARPLHLLIVCAIVAVAVASVVDGLSAQARGAAAAPPVDRVDYLTFAQGAIPVSIGGAGALLGAAFEHAVRITDGSPDTLTIVNGAGADTDTEFVYELPALTTFDRFAVPNVLETPSPAQTFTKLVEVHGSATSATDGYTLLASATLQTHRARGQFSEIPVAAKKPVRWVKLRLVGGIQTVQPRSSFEFSEIIGNGVQEVPALVTRFNGAWQGRGVLIELRQNGPLVSGCYDSSGELTGTVTGNILRATGIDRDDRTPSAFILSVGADGIRGVRSSNRAPFRLYTAPAAPAGVRVGCGQPPAPALGCGSIIHGITFAFDSAEIRPESVPVLVELFKGLNSDRSASIVIEGHTSSEGPDDYNLRLSERRAQAVADDLVRRGLEAGRTRGVGVGETRPIATNNDESGRSLNRRVEIKCT